MGTYKVRNEIETKRNEINENETKRNQQKRNETKRNQRNENEIKVHINVEMHILVHNFLVQTRLFLSQQSVNGQCHE
jgi:hypothetical protein